MQIKAGKDFLETVYVVENKESSFVYYHFNIFGISWNNIGYSKWLLPALLAVRNGLFSMPMDVKSPKMSWIWAGQKKISGVVESLLGQENNSVLAHLNDDRESTSFS